MDRLPAEEFRRAAEVKVSPTITIAVGGTRCKTIPLTRHAVPAATDGITAATPTIALLRIQILTMVAEEEVHQLIRLLPGVAR